MKSANKNAKHLKPETQNNVYLYHFEKTGIIGICLNVKPKCLIQLFNLFILDISGHF